MALLKSYLFNFNAFVIKEKNDRILDLELRNPYNLTRIIKTENWRPTPGFAQGYAEHSSRLF